MRAAILILAVIAAEPAPEARACGNAVQLAEDEATRRVARAERALARGEHRKVIRIIDKEGTTYAMGRLSWTTQDPKDALARARGAEAEAHHCDHRSTRNGAGATLEDLASLVLLAEPEAWAALFLLRLESGDVGGAKAAAKACRKMTDRKGVCT